MKRYQSTIKAQQAPPRSWQAAMLGASTEARTTDQSNTEGTIRTRTNTIAMVRRALNQELKRLARAQRYPRGKPKACVAAPFISPLHQRHVAVVEVHHLGCRDVDEEITGGDENEAFDRLTGLIDDRVPDTVKIHEADGNGERAVLDQIEILAGERRHDNADRLRNDNEAQHLRAREAERARCFELTATHRLDAATHDLANIGSGINDETEDEG